MEWLLEKLFPENGHARTHREVESATEQYKEKIKELKSDLLKEREISLNGNS